MTAPRPASIALCLVIAAWIGTAAFFLVRERQAAERAMELQADQGQTIRNLQAELDAAQTDLETVQAELQTVRTELQTVRGAHTETLAERARLAEQTRTQGAEMEKSAARLAEAAAALTRAGAEIAALKQRNQDLTAKLTGYSDELSQKQKALAQISDTHTRLVGELKREIDQRNVVITQLGDSLAVRLVGHILFPTGQADLTAEGIEVLQRIGDIVGKIEGKRIRIEGHTDNRPISSNLRQKYPSNWELSTARATNVVHFLVDRIGIPAERVEAVGRAEFQPVAANDTEEGRSLNRRIELLLVPEPAAMPELPAAPAAQTAPGG